LGKRGIQMRAAKKKKKKTGVCHLRGARDDSRNSGKPTEKKGRARKV